MAGLEPEALCRRYQHQNHTTPNYPKSLSWGTVTDPALIRENINTEYWNSAGTGTCDSAKTKFSPYAKDICSQYGFDRDSRLRTQTSGLQLDNTSRFMVGEKTLLSANYGIEYFTDRTKSSQRWHVEGARSNPSVWTVRTRSIREAAAAWEAFSPN